MLDIQEDEYGNPIYPPNDDWNPGGPGPTIPDYEDHFDPWLPTQPEVTLPPPGSYVGDVIEKPVPVPTGGFTGSFNAPTMQGYPSLPGVPDAPVPNLPAWKQVPAFSYDPYTPGPDYTAPDPYVPGTFKSPTIDEMVVDPSYNWRKAQGEESLQRWAAARGTLNDSGTAKSLLEYGGNAASQEYANIWNRDFNAFNTNEGNRFGAYQENEGNRFKTFITNEANRAKTYDTNRAGAVQQYNTNYQTQYVDPYKAAYQTAIDTWIPAQETWRARNQRDELGYTTQTGNVRLENAQNYSNAWNQFLFDYTKWKNGPLNDQVFGYGMS